MRGCGQLLECPDGILSSADLSAGGTVEGPVATAALDVGEQLHVDTNTGLLNCGPSQCKFCIVRVWLRPPLFAELSC